MSMNLVDIARKEIGVKEGTKKTNKYAAWYANGAFEGFAWCAMFVSWCFKEAGTPLPRIDDAHGYRDCRSAFNYFKKNKMITSDPRPGDIVLFDWQRDGASDHTGIFVAWVNAQRTKFTSVEGNTSDGNPSNGGMVLERTRNIGAVLCFAAPFKQALILKPGATGPEVMKLQSGLATLGYQVRVDGDFGPQTEVAVKELQKAKGLTPDGIAGPLTLSYIL